MAVIDFHVHLSPREKLLPEPLKFLDGFWSGRGDWNELLTAEKIDAYLEAEGVDLAVGLPEISPLVTGTITNEYIWENFRESERIILFANLNPSLTTELASEVRRLAGMGFKGIKLYPTYQHFYPNDKSLYPMYEVCEELGWPVMAHTGSSVFPGAKIKYGDPLLLDDVAVDFPGLNMLAVHGGRGFWYDRAAFLAQLHDNYYVEISGLPPLNLLKYFPDLERFGHKVVFGSDWPGNPGIRKNMDAVRNLPLSVETKEAILGGTAATILGLGNRAGD